MIGAAGLAMAASLNQSGITSQELAKGQVSEEKTDIIAEQLKKVRENRSKNHDQITDAIYKREYNRYEDLYKDYIDFKKSYENRKQLAGYEL
jgi:gas vesicle protein